MKILLVNPPVNRLCDNAINYFPLGIGYIAAVANRAGFKTYIYNADLETKKQTLLTNKQRIKNHNLFIDALNNDSHRVWVEYREILNKTMPDVVGFSCTSASFLPCLKMAGEAKKLCNSAIVFGGIHPTILPEETAKSENVDYIIAGDAENSFLALVTALSEGRDASGIPGVGRYAGNKFSFIPPEPVEKNVDIFPFPDRDCIINFEEHKNYLQAVITSRGCPYQCTFCSGRNITGGVVRYRSPENVISEIKLLKEKYGMNHIMFYDDSLVLNKKRILKICRMMIDENLKITWGAFTRADSVNRELLSAMKASGCKFLGLGVESGSNKTLRKVNKGYTREQAIAGVKLIKESGIHVDMNIIIGFPHETEEDIKDTISLIRELEIPANINTFTPYPKSRLYDECVERGLIKGDMDWATFSQHSPYNEFIQDISPEAYRKLQAEMIDLADKMMKKHYSGLGHYLKRAREIWVEEDRKIPAFTRNILGKVKSRVAGRA
ncbi:MAG: B12-binding domain-containing radical SAM protein [Nitrospirae bacterium]|nr:B12-binding domain-containing radical SAM protein [Nitrospirota bacterium]